MEYYIIATDSVENIVVYNCLVASIEDDNIQRCWSVMLEDEKVKFVKDFPIAMLQSFYAHSSGMISCKLKCPEYIKKELKDA